MDVFLSLVWRTETIRRIGIRTGLDVVQDLALLLDVAMSGGSLVFDPRVTFRYRQHTDQDSTVRALDGRRFDEQREFFPGGQGFRRSGLDLGRTSVALARIVAAERAVLAAEGGAGHRMGAVTRLGRHVVG